MTRLRIVHRTLIGALTDFVICLVVMVLAFYVLAWAVLPFVVMWRLIVG